MRIVEVHDDISEYLQGEDDEVRAYMSSCYFCTIIVSISILSTDSN